MDDGTIHEEYAEDAPFVDQRYNCLLPFFCIGCNVIVGCFLVVRFADGDLRPFWVARAVIYPNLDSGHRNQIQIQYWMPNTFEHIDEDTYSRWDLKEGNVWCKDKGFLPY
jgi:hypothetical protein